MADGTPATSQRQLIPLDKDRNQRLDQFLTQIFQDRSRSQIQKWIRDQLVLVDGLPTRSAYRIQGNEQIEVRLPESKPATTVPEPIPLDIVYEDSDLAVVNKPAGLAVHTGAGVDRGTLVNALLHHLRHLSRSGGEDRPGIVHRLDKQTSGLLVVAKNDFSHLSLARQFQSRSVTKEYIALVHGELKKDQDEIRAPIGRDRVHRTRMSTRSVRAREAYTLFRVRERFARFTLLEINIKTGRTHQIRVHLSSIRHPIVGDTLYGAPGRIVLPDTSSPVPTLDRNFLHAAALEFSHPRNHQRMRFQCNLPPSLQNLLEKLRQTTRRG
jgi:23S rRNA pseudouridine1911/1915/1917 synthase